MVDSQRWKWQCLAIKGAVLEKPYLRYAKVRPCEATAATKESWQSLIDDD